MVKKLTAIVLLILFALPVSAGDFSFSINPYSVQPGFYYLNAGGGAGGLYLPLIGGTLTGELVTVASGSGGAGFNIPPGGVPTTPQNGDLWTTSTGIYVQISGSTLQLSSGVNPLTGTGTQYYIPVWTSSSTVGSVASVGSAGQVLTSAGPSAYPIWQTPSSGSGTVTSINAANNTPGITVSGTPITSSGTLQIGVSSNLQLWSAFSPAAINCGTTNLLQAVNADGSLNCVSPSVGSGTVTSVNANMPPPFTGGSTPITTAGTLAISYVSGSVTSGAVCIASGTNNVACNAVNAASITAVPNAVWVTNSGNVTSQSTTLPANLTIPNLTTSGTLTSKGILNVQDGSSFGGSFTAGTVLANVLYADDVGNQITIGQAGYTEIYIRPGGANGVVVSTNSMSSPVAPISGALLTVGGGIAQTTATSCAAGVQTNSSGLLSACVASDPSLKTAMGNISFQALPLIEGITPIYYNWIDTNARDSLQHIGFDALQVQSVAPQAAVSGGIDANGKQLYAVDPNAINALLVKTIQEMQAEIVSLQNQIANIVTGTGLYTPPITTSGPGNITGGATNGIVPVVDYTPSAYGSNAGSINGAINPATTTFVQGQ